MKKTIITILILLGLGFAVWAFGTTQGANSPGTVADDNATGTVAWVNPTNATTSDNVYATNLLQAPLQVGHYLKATNFGFSIPAGATINGILVEVEKIGSVTNAFDNAVRIVRGGTIGETDKSNISGWPAVEQYISYGSSSDLWGETWLYSDINDSTFGFVISAKNVSSIQNTTVFVDHIRITITYTEATAGSGQKVQIKSGKFSIGSGKVFIKN